MQPVVVLNIVGLTARKLPLCPQLAAFAAEKGVRYLKDVYPAVTCTAQATMLTGKTPQEHGIVANGWLYRETQEVRFWQQANTLLQAEPIYGKLKREIPGFTCAKLFWWFNQGADVRWSVTPKPFYGIDGGKIFGISSAPDDYAKELEKELGAFPFHTFWGPKAGLPCTEWIAQATARTLKHQEPSLTLAYIPHLDYDPQRFGPDACGDKPWQELDRALTPILQAVREKNARLLLVSEYGHCTVDTPIALNTLFHKQGWIHLRRGPYGDQLDFFQTPVFAVCEHQLAHVYVRDPGLVPQVEDLIRQQAGVAATYSGVAREKIELNHPRSGEIVVLAKANAWFEYKFWPDDAFAPDYARCVAIHHKPGYDPCELFLDPAIRFPLLKIGSKLIRKKLGFRMRMDVVPLDARIVRGSHGVPSADPQDGPLLIGAGAGQTQEPMQNVYEVIEQQFR